MTSEKKTKDYLIIGDIQSKRENLHIVKELLAQVEEIGLPTIFLGDMLDRRGLIETECLNAYYTYFSRSKLNHKIIVGNHDLLSMHSYETALLPLKSLSNVWIIDQPTFLHTNAKVLMVPYYRDPKKFLEAINTSGVEYLFCHQGVREFTIGSGYTEDEAVSVEDLKQFKEVWAGHYHTPKEKIFLGSPFSHSFAEANEIKRLGIFNEDSGMVSFIETDFPKHISFDIDCNEWVKGDAISNQGNNHTRVVLKGTAENIAKFPKDHYPNIKFIEQPEVEEFKSVIKETQTSEEMFKTWLHDVKGEFNSDIEEAGIKILKDSK